ncbi:MAG: Hpt domain-containing protein [Sulfuriflexus sp.]|nr:Hpt domain-containing protein [Sulfuriflexus sp.]
MQDKSNLVSIDIENMLAELRIGFIAELPTRLEEIEQLILDLEKTTSFTEDYQELYRHIHSIKGSAGTHGLHIISTICHVFEDKVVEIEGQQERLTGKMINEWLVFIDLIRTTIDLINHGVVDFSEVEVELEQLSGLGTHYEYKCLVIIASKLHRKLVVNAFEKTPVKFRYALSGYEALGMLLKEPYDMLITNMEVSELQGLSIIGALRMSNNRNKDIPTILLTAGKVTSYGKNIDPNYVIQKNADLIENLNLAVRNIMRQLQEQH